MRAYEIVVESIGDTEPAHLRCELWKQFVDARFIERWCASGQVDETCAGGEHYDLWIERVMVPREYVDLHTSCCKALCHFEYVDVHST